MRIVVQGLGHLGLVTACCLAAAGVQVMGLDLDAGLVDHLRRGELPLYEPGLQESLARGLAAGRLSFSADPSLVAEAGLVWVAIDTPLDDDDRADPAFVENQIDAILPHLSDGGIVVISAQLPVGSTRRIAKRFRAMPGERRVSFSYSPENLRLGTAIAAFTHADRIVVGTEDRKSLPALDDLLGRFSDRIIWMSLESAEMVKHALNAFLATSVTFINEIACIAEKTGAQASDIEEALRSEPRIGRRAYVKPGAAFAGGTLARDVMVLTGLADQHSLATPLLGSIMPSNAAHQLWPMRRLAERFADRFDGRTVAILGLSYKPDSDSLRRSASIDLCRALTRLGAGVQAYDPAVTSLPPDLLATLCPTIDTALTAADAAVLATDWPAFKAVPAQTYRAHMRTALVLDQGGFLAAELEGQAGLDYVTLGRGR